MKITTTIGSIPKIEQQAREDFAAGKPNPFDVGSIPHRIWRLESERLAKLAELVSAEVLPNPLISKVTKIIARNDGSEVRIVAQEMTGIGLHRSVDVYVHRRASPDQDWVLCSNRPHQDWLKMSVDDYIKHGRSEMLQAVSHAEILKLSSMLGKPMADFPELEDQDEEPETGSPSMS